MTDRAEPRDDQGTPASDMALGIRIARRHAAGCVELARPERCNALTLGMRRALAAAYPRFARDPMIYAAVIRSVAEHVFSAGADLRELIELVQGEDRAALWRAVGDALGLCWQHECFSKPTVSLIDGAVMGGGVGISLFGTHRVAGESYRFASPETGIGLAPSNGLCHALARLPGSIGVYLALTGYAISRADAFRLGLATHCIAARHFDEIERHIASADPVDAVLDPLHRDPGPGDLVALEPVIGRCFSAPSVEEIIGRLEAERGSHETWARELAARLRRRSPLALKVAHRLLAKAGGLDLRGVLELDYRVTCRMIEAQDFRQGAQAALSPTQRAPAWNPARLEDVNETMVSNVFPPSADLVLALPNRDEMQARRY